MNLNHCNAPLLRKEAHTYNNLRTWEVKACRSRAQEHPHSHWGLKNNKNYKRQGLINETKQQSGKKSLYQLSQERREPD